MPKKAATNHTPINRVSKVSVAPTAAEVRIMVKFRDAIRLPYEDHLESYLLEKKVGKWSKLQKVCPGATFLRLYSQLKPSDIQKILDRAQSLDSDFKPPNFLNYFVLVSPGATKGDRLVKELLSWKEVESAYLAPALVDPQVDYGNNPRAQYQFYLTPAPLGIDAIYAWQIDGADGEQQELIDLEGGWTLDHEDLVDHGAQVLYGNLVDRSRPHGTRVLGVICAVDNDKGDVGIVPNIDSVNVVSHGGFADNIPEAIFTAVQNLSIGGVLVLEASLMWNQKGPLPVESDPAIFQHIRAATAAGCVVIEAAGNGNIDLDTVTDEAKKTKLKRGSQSFIDSGAILVGSGWRSAAVPGASTPWSRRPDSNYGSRVDCFAWGDSVDTTDADADPTSPRKGEYTGQFNGTSSATAIIAGAAVSVQGMAQAKAEGARLSPLQVRQILSDQTPGAPANTPTYNPAVDKVGVMPNLRAIATNWLNIAPQPPDT